MPLNRINVSVLSNNCPKCQELEKMVEQTVSILNLNAKVEIIDDLEKIKSYGIAKIPSVVINNDVLFNGQLPSSLELKEALLKYCGANFKKKPTISSHQEQIAIYCKALSDPINIFIIEKIRNSKSSCTSLDIFSDLQLQQFEIIERLKELKSAGLITGAIETPMKYCINKINWGIAKILFTNLFK